MKLFKKYNLPADADFVNIELTTDNKIWIDPIMMYMDKSDMSIKCCTIVQQYFKKLLEFAVNKDYKNGYLYTNDFREINETRLGYSVSRPNGLSGGEHLGNEMFNLIKNSEAVETGLIGDIFDAGVMIEKLGIDKMSDFITSLIFEELVLYTQNQCLKYNIPTINVKLNRKYWSYIDQKWIDSQNIDLPFDDESNMAIVFVPKKFCENKLVYSYKRFYSKSMIPFLGQEAVNNHMIGLIRILKDNTIKPLYKEIRKQNPCTRERVNQFINTHNDVYKEYKKSQLTYINYKNYKE